MVNNRRSTPERLASLETKVDGITDSVSKIERHCLNHIPHAIDAIKERVHSLEIKIVIGIAAIIIIVGPEEVGNLIHLLK